MWKAHAVWVRLAFPWVIVGNQVTGLGWGSTICIVLWSYSVGILQLRSAVGGLVLVEAQSGVSHVGVYAKEGDSVCAVPRGVLWMGPES